MLTALLLSLSLAAPGDDVEARLFTLPVETDAGQKQKLGAALVGVFPNAVAATVRNFNCRHEDNDMSKPFGCDGWYKDRKTESELIDLQIAGKAGPALDEGAPEGMADFYRLVNFKLGDAAAQVLLDTFIQATFAGLNLADVYDFRCERDQTDNQKVTCRGTYDDIVSEATYMSLAAAKFVQKPLRRVAP